MSGGWSPMEMAAGVCVPAASVSNTLTQRPNCRKPEKTTPQAQEYTNKLGPNGATVGHNPLFALPCLSFIVFGLLGLFVLSPW